MFQLAALLFGFLLPFNSSAGTIAVGENEAAISKKMNSLVGAQAALCGLVKLGGSVREPWQCAQSHDLAHSAFWLAVEEQPTDSAVWSIIARAPTGKRYVIFYTSSEEGQSQVFAPSFSILACHHPFELRDRKLFVFGCGNDAP